MSCPSKQHYGIVKRILRYVVGMQDYSIMYTHVSNFRLQGYIDNDWA